MVIPGNSISAISWQQPV